ncbi:MAG: hypothetical protein ACI8RA_002806 [Chlamydiales bacterium]|jgi:hypothetical protein
MSAFAIFKLKFPSFLQLEENKIEGPIKLNILLDDLLINFEVCFTEREYICVYPRGCFLWRVFL